MQQFRNRILRALPSAELELLLPHLTRVTLERRESLCDPSRPIESVYFPEDALVSILSVVSDGSALETAMVGNEGMVGLPLFHGVDRTVMHAFVQVGGEAHSLTSERFADLLPQLPTLQRRLHRYAVALFTMATQSSACSRKHSIDQRCARWLLTAHDGAGRAQFDITQQFLSQMLGVRRATVTVAAGVLQRDQLISYSRGRLVVRDRQGLERASCDCYHVVRDEIDRLLGDESWPPSLPVSTSSAPAVVDAVGGIQSS